MSVPACLRTALGLAAKRSTRACRRQPTGEAAARLDLRPGYRASWARPLRRAIFRQGLAGISFRLGCSSNGFRTRNNHRRACRRDVQEVQRDRRKDVRRARPGPHFARVDCRSCGAFIDWVKYPDAAPRSSRRKSRKKLRDLGDRCETRLRHRDELPTPQQLDVHHVLEVAADEGSDDEENLRVDRSACHAMVNWIRT